MAMMPGANRRQILKGALGVAGATAIGSRGGRIARAQAVKLVNVEHDSRPLDNAAYQAVYDAFKQQNPDIEIEFQIIPWEQARSKMLTLAQGDSLPDMGRMEWASDYAAAEMLVPLDDRVDQATLDRFDKLSLEYGSAVGSDGEAHLYALPWFQGSAAILVNKTFLDKVGLPLKDEWTTDEFTEYAKALTLEGQHWGVALDVAGIGDPVQNLLLAVYAYGGKWVAGDTSSTEPEPIVFNSPETVAGITWYSNLFTAGYAVPSAPTDTYKERDANFQAGKAAMEWQGPWSLLEIQDNFSKGGYELASMPLPKGPAGNPNWYGGAHASIYTSAEKKGVVDQAFKWISFLSSDEGQKLYCKTNGMIPASKLAQQDPLWAENNLYKGYLNSFPTISRMDPIWATGLSSILDDTVPPLLQGVFNGQLKPEEMAQQVQDAVVDGLKQNGVDVPES
ncbi:MAG: multiple sugar transport system substrate-binding protein [Thermomicrobiales bacterium]|jgi:ABC-type glycerol-3-phosphate transport system substrate-binding protein|nr:multiple sugar transport system substrate-binding protein [Thermomicrobiales bacterium]